MFEGRRSLLSLGLGLALAFGLTGAAQAQRKFTFGYDQPRSTAYGVAADIFDAKLKEPDRRAEPRDRRRPAAAHHGRLEGGRDGLGGRPGGPRGRDRTAESGRIPTLRQ